VKSTQLQLLGGRYELDGVVGRGGMAEVYRARDIRLDRIVAVKTLRDDLARDQKLQARFRREAQSAASLNDASIIAVYDTGEDTAGPAAVPYIVMEYVHGRTLAEVMHEDGRLLPERAMEIADGVLRALEFSHRNGIVHRDIKPANVMLTRAGDVKVMDFGIARSLSASQSTITGTAQVIGTAQYMSPEQARGGQVDARSDLYSTGCLLYELLTGRPPFSGDSPVAIAYQQVRENPIPPSRLDPELPRWADAIVLKAMAKDPADRYQSAAEMRADIQRVASGAPVTVSPRPRWQPTEGIGGLATAEIPGYGYGPQEPPKRRHRVWPWILIAAVVLAAVAAAGYDVLGGGGGGDGGGGKTYTVPQVTGLSYTTAAKRIVHSHLRQQRINQTSATVPKNHVISTDPAAGAMVTANSLVTVYVSSGSHPAAAPSAAPATHAPPQRVTVPDLEGEDAGTAQATLRAAGLKPVVVEDRASSAAVNTVVSQHPAAGTKVDPGSRVTLDVSVGTAVADVTGDSASSATSVLEGQGFKVAEINQSDPDGQSTTPPGSVYRQDPAGGTLLARGQTITIYVQPTTPLRNANSPAGGN
jgi:eukaryotic-like serine/threonine-protein kinase